MREFKYNSFRLYPLYYVIFISALLINGISKSKTGGLVAETPIEYHLLIFLMLSLFSVHTIVISRTQIVAQLYFMPFVKYRSKTWREIKHYVHVKEMYYKWGRYSTKKIPKKTLWFIDYNDKVCFRVKKSSILKFNSSDFLQNVDRFEDKLLEEIEFDQPYLMKLGLQKVKFPNKIQVPEKITKEKLAKKLGISIEELEQRIQTNKKAEEDKIESNAKNKPN